MATADARERAVALLDRRRVLTLAFADAEGPWAADVYYVRDGPALVFLSSPRSRHAQAFAAGAAAAGTVHEDAEGVDDIRGIQASGRVEEVAAGAARERALDLYGRRYPFAKELLFGAARLLDRVRVYRFVPERVLFVDNGRGFGERTDLTREWASREA